MPLSKSVPLSRWISLITSLSLILPSLFPFTSPSLKASFQTSDKEVFYRYFLAILHGVILAKYEVLSTFTRFQRRPTLSPTSQWMFSD